MPSFVNYKILYRHFVIALCRKTNVLFAFNADRKLVEHLYITAVTYHKTTGK